MSTFIDGIAASQALDTAGEVLDIQGLDISSLEGSVFNFEHKSDSPDKLVGKILKARKIFSDADCQDDRDLYYWNKCQLPFLYVMGELFDDQKPSAKEVSAMFMYDHTNKGKIPPTLGFSIEGAKLNKNGAVIENSIARKVTITQCPANKTCVAEMIPAPGASKKDNMDDFFKSEPTEIEIKPMSKMEPSAPLMMSENKLLGQTSSDKSVFSQGRVGQYKGFTHQDHSDAAGLHNKAAEGVKDFKQRDFHTQKAKLHSQAASTLKEKGMKPQSPKMPKVTPTTEVKPNLGTNRKLFNPDMSITSSVTSIKKSEIFDHTDGIDKDSSTLMNRTEDKYFLSRAALDYVNQAIKENLKEGDIDTEVRNNTNRSIYLDTPDLDSLKDSLNSVKPRIKIRVRQYSPNSEGWEKIAYVEIKSKEADGESKKIRVRIHSDQIESFTQGNPMVMSEDLANINKDISKAILEKRIKLLNHLVSLYGYRDQVEIRYERRAYTSKDVRITIDENLRFLNPKEVSNDNVLAIKITENWVNVWHLDHQLKNEGYYVLEVKYQGDMPKWIEKVLDKSQAKKVSFSKYASAMVCVIEAKAHKGYVSSQAIIRESPEMNKALKFGTLADQAATAKMVAERKNNPKAPKPPKAKPPELKGIVHSEVSHVTEHYNPKELHSDIVHLKTGHESHGQPKNKFKAGDKVTMTPHIQGTHVLEHGHKMNKAEDKTIKGVHSQGRGNAGPGESNAGVMARAAVNGKSPVKQGGEDRQMAAAKQMHSRKLGELKAMPKLNLTKTLEAGSGLAAPGQLVQGAALAGKPKKNKWLEMAKDEYSKWGKREDFVKFMQKKMPSLSKGQIDAIGQTLCLKKTIKAEKSLSDLSKFSDIMMASEKTKK